MKRKSIYILNEAVFCMLLLISSTFAAENQANETYSGLGFYLLKPKNITVTCENPVEDFQVYRFLKGDSLILSIYSGNAPSFPSEKNNTKPKISIINGYKTESYEKKDSNNIHHKELLMHISKDFPNFLHIWYSIADPGQITIAESILMSIKKGSGNGCFENK